MAYKISNTLKPCHKSCQNLGKTQSFTEAHQRHRRLLHLNHPFSPGRAQITHRNMRRRVHTKEHWTHRTSLRHTRRTALEASRVHTTLCAHAVPPTSGKCNLINCIEEHRTSLSSSVCKHLQANPDYRVDFHNPEVIGNDNKWQRLQILESSLIQEYKPKLNADIPSMLLCIFNLQLSFMPHSWHHAPSPLASIQLSHVTTYASRHYVTTKTALRVSHFSQRFSPAWPIRTCSMITAVQFAVHLWW